MTILFENCRVFDGASAEISEGMNLVIANGQIQEISENKISVNNAERINLQNKFLMPGLIDAHFHAAAVVLDQQENDLMSLTLRSQYSRQILEDAVFRGFTSVRDAGGADHGLAQAVNRGLINGPRLFYAGKALSQTGGHGDNRALTFELDSTCCANAFAVVADGVDEVRKAAREELRKGADHIKICLSGGIGSSNNPLRMRQYSESEVKAVVEEAHSREKYVMAHVYGAPDIKRALDCGVRSFEHANFIDHKTASLVSKKEAFVVPTLAIFEQLLNIEHGFNFSKERIEEIRGLAEAGLQSLDICRKEGVPLGFGTDLIGSLHKYQNREFIIRSQVLSNLDVLRSATSINANIIGRNDLGRIREGAVADLIVLSESPMEDMNVLVEQDNILLVMKDGKFLKRMTELSLN